MKVPKPKVVKDPAYLQWLREMACWGRGRRYHKCGDTMGRGWSEVSHLDGRSRDDRCLPMCGALHRTDKHSWHQGQKTFCEYYGTTKAKLIQQAESLYASFKEGK